jgi:hypothetical protein
MGDMKEILYKKRQSLKYRRKIIAIDEHNEDNDCRTHVRKSFAYIVTMANPAEGALSAPEIHIKKNFDSKAQTEKFSFRVKGAFYMEKDRYVLKVNFCHTLKIDIYWKNKVFSPKKSATLT